MKNDIIFPLSMAPELQEIILSWGEVFTSPYSLSYYNMPGKSWTNTPEGSLRVADHWNFKAVNPYTFETREHCKTNVPVPANAWVIARYSGGVYEVLAVYPKLQFAVMDGELVRIISEQVHSYGDGFPVSYSADLDNGFYYIWHDFINKKMATKFSRRLT